MWARGIIDYLRESLLESDSEYYAIRGINHYFLCQATNFKIVKLTVKL
jgi:hypothetical protein